MFIKKSMKIISKEVEKIHLIHIKRIEAVVIELKDYVAQRIDALDKNKVFKKLADQCLFFRKTSLFLLSKNNSLIIRVAGDFEKTEK